MKQLYLFYFLSIFTGKHTNDTAQHLVSTAFRFIRFVLLFIFTLSKKEDVGGGLSRE